MSFPVPLQMLNTLSHEDFSSMRRSYASWNNDPKKEVKLDISRLSEDAIVELSDAFKADKNMKSVRLLNAVLGSRRGEKDQKISGIETFADLLKNYLDATQINKWIFRREKDGQLYPYLITSIEYRDSESFNKIDKDEYHVLMRLTAYGISSDNEKKMATKKDNISFHRHHVSNRKISTVLAAFDLFPETTELIAEHEAQVTRYRSEVMPHFAKQFVANGKTVSVGYKNEATNLKHCRVIHDLTSDDFGPYNDRMEADTKTNDSAVFPCPFHPMVRVFDLESHNFHWINSNLVKPYEYKTLLQHLVLPESHHDLLDMLTDDLKDFSHDFVEGKAAGNMIICKGPPGVGKTLTAELYAEHKKVPLIVLKAGKLGTTVAEVTKGMKQYLDYADRWTCPLLINECDIYVAKRANDIGLNAIVSEMLDRTEYYAGLLFMSTNRPDDIDDAFISRALAIINYKAPEGDLINESWKQIASLHGLEFDDATIEKFKAMFPTIVQRDMKMLLKLALKKSKRTGEKITPDLMRRMAIFRAIDMADNTKELVS